MIDRRRKGFGLIVNTAVAVVIVAVALIIGIYVIGSIQQALPTSNLPESAAGNITKVIGTVYSAYQLMPILIIVLIAAAIIGTIFVFGGRSPTR
jgi:NADH:ubiquinone oxidoreductase subunit 6 (subunit J)